MPARRPPAPTTTDKDASRTPGGRRLQVRRSGVHGRGVWALCDLKAGERLIEYTGEIITWQEALARHPHDPGDPNHTFYFHIDDGRVIDAKHGGNSSRWINHSCNPNCVATQEGDRVFIDALRDIAAGEELFYHYGLFIDEPLTPAVKRQYPCWCGHTECTGTLLNPRRGRRASTRKSRRSVPDAQAHTPPHTAPGT